MGSGEIPRRYPFAKGIAQEYRHFLPSSFSPFKRTGEVVRAYMLRTVLARRPDQAEMTVYEISRPQVGISICAYEKGDGITGPLEEKHLTAINGALRSGLEIACRKTGANASELTTAKIFDPLSEGLAFSGSGKDAKVALRNAAVKMISRQADTQPQTSEKRVEDPVDIKFDSLDRLLNDGKRRADVRFFEGEVIIVAGDHIFRGSSFEEACSNAVLEDSIKGESPQFLI